MCLCRYQRPGGQKEKKALINYFFLFLITPGISIGLTDKTPSPTSYSCIAVKLCVLVTCQNFHQNFVVSPGKHNVI